LHFERVVLAGCSIVWLLVILANGGVLPLAGTLDLDLYRLFSLTTVIGWVAGNIYVFRTRDLVEKPARRKLFLKYLMGPLSVVFFLRALAGNEVQASAPLVPIFGFGIYVLFFLVPVTLRATRTQHLSPRDPET